MADIPSLNLDFPDISGDENSWGEILNEIMGTQASKSNDTVAISTVGGTTILSDAQELVGSIVVTGVLASAGILEFSGRTGLWLVSNETTGAYTLTVRIGAAGDTLAIARGKAQIVCCTGTAWIGTPAGGDFLPIDGSSPMTGDLDMAGNNIDTNGGDIATGGGAIDTEGGGLSLGYGEITTLGRGTASDSAATMEAISATGCRNLVVRGTGNAAVTISAAELTLRNGESVYNARSVNLTLNTGSTGANGMDTGPVPADGYVYFYVIWNGTTVSGLASASASSPTMPSGYTHKRYVGGCYVDASSRILRFVQIGNHFEYIIGTLPSSFSDLLVASGYAESSSVSLSGNIPDTAGSVILLISTDGGTTDDYVEISMLGVTRGSVSSYGTQSVFGSCVPASASLSYTSLSGNGWVGVLGWVDNAV